MPYIAQGLRKTAERTPLNEGELNFAVTRLLLDYLDRRGLSYATLNECVGALECCKCEFVRRVVNPYEEGKRATNGDVF